MVIFTTSAQGAYRTLELIYLTTSAGVRADPNEVMKNW